MKQVFENCTTEVSHLLLDEDEDNNNNNNSDNKNSKKFRHADEFVAFKNIQTQSKIGVNPPRQIARVLMEPDFRLIEALIHSQQNFVLSDPSLPDNPIVYCSDGFCNLTGYKRSSVIGMCIILSIIYSSSISIYFFLFIHLHFLLPSLHLFIFILRVYLLIDQFILLPFIPTSQSYYIIVSPSIPHTICPTFFCVSIHSFSHSFSQSTYIIFSPSPSISPCPYIYLFYFSIHLSFLPSIYFHFHFLQPGRNCRFLQGPGTDQAAVDIIRKGVLEGCDISVCLVS